MNSNTKLNNGMKLKNFHYKLDKCKNKHLGKLTAKSGFTYFKIQKLESKT